MSNWNEQPESTGNGMRGFAEVWPYILAVIIGLGGVAGVTLLAEFSEW